MSAALRVVGVVEREGSFRFMYRAPKWPPWQGDYCVNFVRAGAGNVTLLSSVARCWSGPEAIAIEVEADDAEFAATQLFAEHVDNRHGDFA